ncbi:MAG: hypothetical protein IPF53_14630 [Blastocatellia bacterium]|nr:hypothetical protein [Blastocatellia bacterium]
MNRRDPAEFESRGAERITGVALAIALAVIGAALAYHYGPRPEAHADTARATSVEATRRAPAVTDRSGATLFESLGLATNRTASGQSDLDVDAILDDVERTYVRRGFTSGNAPGATVADSGKAGPTRRPHELYFRSDCPVGMIVGVGRNANPAAEAAPETTDFVAYVTLVSPVPGGGSAWATFRYDRTAVEALSKIRLVDANGDFPGIDPPGVPRIPGSRRMLAVPRLSGSGALTFYEVGGSIADIRAYAMAEMERAGWRLDPYQMIEVAGTGAFIFTMGDLTCTLWIQQNAVDADRVGIVVVSQ